MTDLSHSLGVNALLILGAAALIGIGTLVILRARRDLLGEPDPSDRDPLASYREAYERGQMDEVEYRRILDALARPSGDDRTSSTAIRRSATPGGETGVTSPRSPSPVDRGIGEEGDTGAPADH